MIDTSIAVAVIAAFGGGAGLAQLVRVYLDWRNGMKTDEREAVRSNREAAELGNKVLTDLIDDFQQQILNERGQVAAERAQVELYQTRIDTLELRLRVVSDYAAQLRRDIMDGEAPPPRDWPDGLS